MIWIYSALGLHSKRIFVLAFPDFHCQLADKLSPLNSIFNIPNCQFTYNLYPETYCNC